MKFPHLMAHWRPDMIDTGRTPVEAPVLWTRGAGCRELAGLLGSDSIRVVGDLQAACVDHRAELLVSRRLPGDFELVSLAVPVDLRLDKVEAVAAAVAGGPHSALAALTASRLGRALGVPALMASAYSAEGKRSEAVAVIEKLAPEVPGLEYRAVHAADMGGLIADLPQGTLLVIGAPGGNWFQRLIFGAGARLRMRAPVGAIVVRQAPPRVFQAMVDPIYVGPWREAADTLRTHDEKALAVVDQGMLIGVVRRETLEEAHHHAPVAEIMDEPLAVDRLEAVAAAEPLRVVFDGGPVPVTDQVGHMVGSLYLPAA